jgi:hypothetical protein
MIVVMQSPAYGVSQTDKGSQWCLIPEFKSITGGEPFLF